MEQKKTKNTGTHLRSLQTYGVMTLFSLFICAFVRKNLMTIASLDQGKLSYIGMVTLLSLGILVITNYVFNEAFTSYRAHQLSVRKFLGPITTGVAILLAVVAAIGEELLFRGVLQSYIGIGLTSALVLVLHISPDLRFTAWSLMACLNSAILGVVFEYTKSIYPGILIHMTLNLIFLLRTSQIANHSKKIPHEPS